MVVLNGAGIFLMEETNPISGLRRQKRGFGRHKIDRALFPPANPGHPLWQPLH